MVAVLMNELRAMINTPKKWLKDKKRGNAELFAEELIKHNQLSSFSN
jgi:hypothetical protein